MSSSDLKIFNPTGNEPIAPTYSQICIVPLRPTTKLITFAGQVGHDSTTGETPPAFSNQVAIALANVDKCLVAAGATKKDIVQVRHYVVKLSAQSESDRHVRSELYIKYMDGHKPPSTLVGVESLATPQILYEIEVTAVVNGGA